MYMCVGVGVCVSSVGFNDRRVFMKGRDMFIYLSWLKISQLSKTETALLLKLNSKILFLHPL